jgi:hypothetical protein
VRYSRFELVAALRELLHLPEEADARASTSRNPGPHATERQPILLQRDLKQPPYAARDDDVEVAPEGPHDLSDRRRNRFDQIAVTLPRRIGRAVLLPEFRLAEALRFARVSVERQKVASTRSTSIRNAA